MKQIKTVVALLEMDGHTTNYLLQRHNIAVEQQSFINCLTNMRETPSQVQTYFKMSKCSETLVLQALLDEQKYLDATLICYKMATQKWYIRQNKPQAGTNLIGVEMHGAELVELHDVVAQLKQKQIA